MRKNNDFIALKYIDNSPIEYITASVLVLHSIVYIFLKLKFINLNLLYKLFLK